VKDRILGMTVGADEYVGPSPTTFTYLIQRAATDEPERRPHRCAARLGPARQDPRVDDSPTYLDALARVLREDGHDIILAGPARRRWISSCSSGSSA